MNQNSITIEKVPALNRSDWFQFAFLVFGAVLLTFVFALFWFSSAHIPHNFTGIFHFFDIFLFSLLSYVVWYQITNEIFFWDNILAMKKPVHIEPKPGLRVAFITAFVPSKEPVEILKKTLKAMVSAHYRHDTWVLDEGDSEEVKMLCRKLGVKHFTRKGIFKYNQKQGIYKMKTKAGNYNSWFDRHSKKYDVVAQLDMDFVPSRDFLLKTLGYFRDKEVAFVGSPQIYGNHNESWIAKGAAQQAFNFHGPIQKGLYGKGMPLFIGSNHTIRVKAHSDIKGYAGHIVEDHLTGMKFYAKRWKSVYLPEILAIGEGPSTWDAYFSQQMRWAYGLFHILFTQSPRLITKMKINHALNYLWLQQYYFYGLGQIIGILLLSLYFFFGINATSMVFSDLLVLYVPLLTVHTLMSIWVQRFNIDRKNESGVHAMGKLLSVAVWPIYFIALLQVISGRRLVYKTTPKGANGSSTPSVSLFFPHFILGTITLFCIIAAFYTKNNSRVLLFWAVLNTVFMYGFFFVEFVYAVKLKVSKLNKDAFIFKPQLD
ncbi:MAG TPA: glycosyltransferase family 2 protein [Candidatus Saccharimonadales bacterium]|nr:glycosyltransferase family 2 protein [Candidatus Saccharimonadales bacterium]